MLTTLGKLHELCDDLESLWFVLLYEALHLVKHNKPSGIKMQTLFDHAEVCPETGIHTGGVGKQILYHSGDILMTRTLQFESKPLTTLIGKIFCLFRTLNKYYRAIDREKKPSRSTLSGYKKLNSCTEMKKLLTEALKSTRWPENCDKVEDQYPPRKKGKKTPQEKNTIALSHVNRPLPQSTGEPSGTKRGREVEVEGGHSAPANKRPKVQPRLGQILSKCVKFFWG